MGLYIAFYICSWVKVVLDKSPPGGYDVCNMYRPKDTQERIIHRLQISLGQLEKVLQMVRDDVYCIDVLHQMQAVREAIKQTEDVVMANHLKSCVKASKSAIEEVMSVVERRHG